MTVRRPAAGRCSRILRATPVFDRIVVRPVQPTRPRRPPLSTPPGTRSSGWLPSMPESNTATADRGRYDDRRVDAAWVVADLRDEMYLTHDLNDARVAQDVFYG